MTVNLNLHLSRSLVIKTFPKHLFKTKKGLEMFSWFEYMQISLKLRLQETTNFYSALESDCCNVDFP